MKNLSVKTITVAGVGCVFLALAACGDNESQGGGRPQNMATRVIVSEIRPQSFIDEVEALGTARANESIEIKPRIPSLVTGIGFTEGKLVKKGDLLVELDSRQIRAGLAVAEAELEETRSVYNRNRSLIDTQAISAANLEQLRAAMQVDEAAVEAERARLDNTLIIAPFDGRVGLRRVSPGSYVDTQTIITTLDDTETIKLDFTVPETFITVLSEGMAIEAESLVYPGRRFTGTVDSIDTRLDPVSRSIQVRALLPNSDGALKPGMFLSVNLKRDRGELLVAPEEAIVPEGASQYVYKVVDGKAVQQTVTLGRRIPGQVEIVSGLEAGDVVVTEGTQKIRPGSQLDVVQQQANGDVSRGPGG